MKAKERGNPKEKEGREKASAFQAKLNEFTLERLKGGWQWQTKIYSQPNLNYVVKVPRLFWWGLPLFWRLIPSIRDRIFSSYEIAKERLGDIICDYRIEKNFSLRIWQGKGVKTTVAPKIIKQRKATPLSNYLKKLTKEEKQDEAKLWLGGFVDLVSLAERKGLVARDRWLIGNWGINEVARIVWLDPGLLLGERTTLGRYLQRLEDRFCIWLTKRTLKHIDLELATYYMEIVDKNSHGDAKKIEKRG
ncbi:MAG: hypothetical protein MOIL_01134 [Candidatus Methanolliviera sp. GoM_oil]|nr:MAG: hypothetical protein MOIL_01134 [Candidatus Methanolliviera sp. GoM_oil]